MTKSFLFLLFLFGIGYSVGPQFMQSLKRDGLNPVLVAMVSLSPALPHKILVAKVLGLDPGFAAGLMSVPLTKAPLWVPRPTPSTACSCRRPIARVLMLTSPLRMRSHTSLVTLA